MSHKKFSTPNQRVQLTSRRGRGECGGRRGVVTFLPNAKPTKKTNLNTSRLSHSNLRTSAGQASTARGEAGPEVTSRAGGHVQSRRSAWSPSLCAFLRSGPW